MDLAYLSAASALLGSAAGGVTSVASTWLARRHQDRSLRLTQEWTRRERIFGAFIDQASKMFAQALSQTHLEDPASIVPLYATMGKLRLFASERTIAAAQEVMNRVVEMHYLPSPDFRSRPSRNEQEFDLLRDFTEACRAELHSPLV
jgi:hypothetical protein